MPTDWYYAREGQRQGPVPETRLRELIAAGQVRSDDLVWRAGFPDWRPLREAPELLPPAPPIAAAPGAVVPSAPALPLSMRWVPVYCGIMAVIAALQIASSIAHVLTRHGRAGAGVLFFTWIPAGVAIAVAWGLSQRRRWAWQVNFWLYLVAPLVLGALVFAAVTIGFVFVERRWRPMGIGVAPAILFFVFALAIFSLWPALNLVYFKRRRDLFRD